MEAFEAAEATGVAGSLVGSVSAGTGGAVAIPVAGTTASVVVATTVAATAVAAAAVVAATVVATAKALYDSAVGIRRIPVDPAFDGHPLSVVQRLRGQGQSIQAW
jgi:hypothetical protein